MIVNFMYSSLARKGDRNLDSKMLLRSYRKMPVDVDISESAKRLTTSMLNLSSIHYILYLEKNMKCVLKSEP